MALYARKASQDVVPVDYAGVQVETEEGVEELKIRASPISTRESSQPYMLTTLESVAKCSSQQDQQEQVALSHKGPNQVIRISGIVTATGRSSSLGGCPIYRQLVVRLERPVKRIDTKLSCRTGYSSSFSMDSPRDFYLSVRPLPP